MYVQTILTEQIYISKFSNHDSNDTLLHLAEFPRKTCTLPLVHYGATAVNLAEHGMEGIVEWPEEHGSARAPGQQPEWQP